jgi:hypothetical protein
MSITQKGLNELMEWLKPYTPDQRLKMLLEAARTTGIKELELAIALYWQDEADQLTPEEYAGAQERSINEQFGGNNDE